MLLDVTIQDTAYWERDSENTGQKGWDFPLESGYLPLFSLCLVYSWSLYFVKQSFVLRLDGHIRRPTIHVLCMYARSGCVLDAKRCCIRL